jgi:hypothetical protein
LLAYLFQWFLFVFPSGTSPFSELAAQTGHCFDLAVEAAVSGGLVLIQRHAEIGKRGVIQGGAEEVSISFSSRSVVSAKGEIAGVGGDDRVFKSQGVCPITGPRGRKRGQAQLNQSGSCCCSESVSGVLFSFVFRGRPRFLSSHRCAVMASISA